MNKTQLFYVATILVSLRFGIEYNLYLLNQLWYNYHLFNFMDLTIFFLYFIIFPSILGLSFIHLFESKQKKTPLEFHNKMEKTRKNICWNCESESEKDSLFCLTCGIELNLKKHGVVIKESNIEIKEK